MCSATELTKVSFEGMGAFETTSVNDEHRKTHQRRTASPPCFSEAIFTAR
jgi:hypothetical protein